MLTRKNILHLALALAKGSDDTLWREDTLLAKQGLSEEDSQLAKEIGRIVALLCRDYDYTESVGFLEEIKSKTETVGSMMRKIEGSPSRKSQHREDLYAAIRYASIDSLPLKRLVKLVQVPLVCRLESLLDTLTLPVE